MPAEFKVGDEVYGVDWGPNYAMYKGVVDRVLECSDDRQLYSLKGPQELGTGKAFYDFAVGRDPAELLMSLQDRLQTEIDDAKHAASQAHKILGESVHRHARYMEFMAAQTVKLRQEKR